MRHTFTTITTLAILALTACGNSTTQEPASTATNAVTTTAPTVASTPSQSTAVTNTTPPVTEAPISSAGFTQFEGALATGETITFEILTEDAQEYLNQAGKTAGLKGSWGALCSTELTANQLGGYTVVTTENNGQGHAHEWMNFLKVDRKMEPTLDQAMENSLIEYVQGQAKNLGECFPLQTELTSGGEQEYPSASIGQTIQGELNGATELTGK